MSAAAAVPSRPRSTVLAFLAVWLVLYASFTLFYPALLDDADSVHVEVAREMLMRHDYVTLYANGIRYLEKAPLLYWSMAACLRLAMLAGIDRPALLAAAARVPLAWAVLALGFCGESLARRMFRSARAGLLSGLMLFSSFGVFIFTRITIPDALVCVWIAVALWCFWATEMRGTFPLPRDQALQRETPKRETPTREAPEGNGPVTLQWYCWGFAAACALNVLTKGLIGVVFPVGIVAVYLLLTRGMRRAVRRVRAFHPGSSLLVFLAMAAPWHIFAALANPTQGHPAPFLFVRSSSAVLPWGHWQVPLPTDGNVRGWAWFYFMNEHVLRYLNLRVPRDYDTVPLLLFWGLCFVWLMPWSAFVFEAVRWAVPVRSAKWRGQLRRHDLPLPQRARLLLVVWAGFVLAFFSLSTRQEYYVLPALPALAVLIGGWFSGRLTQRAVEPTAGAGKGKAPRQAGQRAMAVLAAVGLLAAGVCVYFVVQTRTPDAHTDLAQLLQGNPGEYALSFGHFLDLNAKAMGLFRVPLLLTAVCLGGGWPAAYALHQRRRAHASLSVLAVSTCGFLVAAHLGLQTFAPVLSSAALAEAIRPQVHPADLVVIHGEYEAGSTLGFYLKRNDVHLLEGRSSNLWYGSFFPDAPPRFETPASLAARWQGSQRVFLWQSLPNMFDTPDALNTLPPLPGRVYVLATGGGKEIVSNQANR